MAEWYTRTTQGGFISADEVQSCAIQSQKASAILRTKSIALSLPAATTCQGLGFGSTGFVVWKPSTNVTLASAYLVPLTTWNSSSTAQVAVQLWACSAGVVGNVNTSSTAFAPGTFMAMTINSTSATMSANESLMAWSNASSCQLAPVAFSIIVNYETTG